MGEFMNKKNNSILSIIFPYKKINIFVILLVIIGLSLGAIYARIININDETLVIEKIKQFINNINNNSLSSLIILKNSLSINILYTILIWLLGLTIIGIFIAILLTLLKDFILGFTIASFIITYKYKGLLLSGLYLIFGELLNIIIIIFLSSYSIHFTINTIKKIIKAENINNKKYHKNYLYILLIALFVNIISSISTSFVLPALIKLIVKLYV